jgi:hypothetical protein
VKLKMLTKRKVARLARKVLTLTCDRAELGKEYLAKLALLDAKVFIQTP